MAAPMLLDEQVRHNKAATVRLFILVFLILAGLVFAIGLVLGYPPIVTGILALVIGLVYLGIASSTGVETILKAARARPANPNVREERLLLYAVEEMAIAAGLSPVPKVYVQEDDDINAF
ncbi:MAG TPA: hypothetical protein VHI93_07340, partial [Candidatus Thermoplasmatota archaeon]|nr:hypothetical protein [Candidatus Thermoplasmatota archaeon]